MPLDQEKCFCIDMATRMAGNNSGDGDFVIALAKKIEEYVKIQEPAKASSIIS